MRFAFGAGRERLSRYDGVWWPWKVDVEPRAAIGPADSARIRKAGRFGSSRKAADERIFEQRCGKLLLEMGVDFAQSAHSMAPESLAVNEGAQPPDEFQASDGATLEECGDKIRAVFLGAG